MTDQDSLTFKDTLQFCLAKEAPKTLNSSKTQLTIQIPLRHTDSRYTYYLAVSKLCVVETDLSKIPKELFQRYRNSTGKEYYKVLYQLVLTPMSASLLFELEFNGISYGTVRSRY